MPSTLATVKALPLGDTLSISLLGIAVGFVVLVSLMLIVYLMRFFAEKLEASKSRPEIALSAANKTPVPAAANSPQKVPAEGSFGEIDLHTVDDATAAILMAIVADEIGAPPNELRFLSIRELPTDAQNTVSPQKVSEDRR